MNEIIEKLTFWIFTTFITFFTSLVYNRYNNFKKTGKTEAKHMKFGLLSLLKSEILKTHEKCLKNGYCSIYEIELAEEIYRNYSKLGGNGCAKKLIYDLKKLPIKTLE